MSIGELKKGLEDFIHTKLYENNDIDNSSLLNDIKEFLNTSDNIIDDIRTIVSSRNNENYFAYDDIISELLLCCNLDTKKNILINFSQYGDLIKDNKIYIDLWNSLNKEEKIEYLENKKKYSSLDILLINDSIKESNSFKENEYIIDIFNNDKIIKKIDNYSIILNVSFDVLSFINLNDIDKCIKLSKETYTNLLLKKCKTFNEFYNMYMDNNDIFKLINTNGLIFNNDDNEDIYKFILDNTNFIGKFNKKYLDLFSILEITDISKNNNIDSESYACIIEQLYKYNHDKALEYFNEESLSKCLKHSISVYPFNDLKDSKIIFDQYNLFNRFIDTIMIEAINNNFNEDDIVNILRNDSFIEDTSSYGIELLINKLSFKAAFNMLQRKVIFNKINNLNVKVNENDVIFLKGYLDSPVLVYKSEHSMIYEMLSLLNSNEVMYYITLPYILSNLSNYELINLVINHNLRIKDVLDNKNIYSKFNVTDIINLIDKSDEKNIDLEIFKNKQLVHDLFNLKMDDIDNINFDEVNYLFETVKMKAILSKQDGKFSVLRYKSILTSYLVLGLNETLKIVDEGNRNITLNSILDLKKEIIDEKILLFKENNSTIFQNMAKKITRNLLQIDSNLSLIEFGEVLRKNTYLDNIMYLMLDNNFTSYNDIVERLYSFRKCLEEDELSTKKDIYEYTKKFIDVYLYNKVLEYDKEFDNIILKNFKVKEDVIYRKRKELGSVFIDKLKYSLFVRCLMDTNKESYKNYFIDDFDILEIKNKYLEELDCENVDFDSILEHVLLPIVNERFDKENCLNKLGIKKPDNTDLYFQYNNDKKNITKLNKLIKKLKDVPLSNNDILSIMEYILYGSELPYKITKKELNKLNKYRLIRDSISIELYIDKDELLFTSSLKPDIYNEADIKYYNKYLKILDDILKKTKKFVNTYMDKESIKNNFSHDYFKAMNTDDIVFPITNKYYEPIKRVLSLVDFETIFNGYILNDYGILSDSLKDFLFKKNNLVLVVDGYYNGLIDNLGIIINNWEKIIKYANDNELSFKDLTLIGVENILSIINFSNNKLCKSLSKKVINEICEDGCYEINDLNKRINILEDLYEASFKRITSTVPYLCYKDDIYRIEILDNYNEDIYLSLANSIYKIGAIGNDFLHYSILDKNGIQLGIYKNDELISKVLGVRNGNTLYLSSLVGLKDLEVNRLLGLFANELVSITNSDKEPIHFVTIVNNDIYSSTNGLRMDTTICPIINDPINKTYYDYEEFILNKNLINGEDIVTNYEDNISTLLASSLVVDKDNFKYYDAEDKYYRCRNDIIKLSNNIGEDYLNRIDMILYLCKKLDDSIDVDNISLSSINTIYLGDDFVLFVYDNAVDKFILPYDKRALKEVDMILEKINM